MISSKTSPRVAFLETMRFNLTASLIGALVFLILQRCLFSAFYAPSSLEVSSPGRGRDDLFYREVVLSFELPPGVPSYENRTIPAKEDVSALPPHVFTPPLPRPRGAFPRVFVFTIWDCNLDPTVVHHQLRYIREVLKVPPKSTHLLLHIHPERNRYEQECIDIVRNNPDIWFSRWPRTFSVEERVVIFEETKRFFNVTDDDWLVKADGDELHSFPPGMSLAEFLDDCDRNEISHVHGKFADRVSPDGSLTRVVASQPLEDQYPLICNLTGTINKLWVTKVIAMRANIRVNEGGFHILHRGQLSLFHTRGYRHPGFRVHHFKFVEGLTDNMQERASRYRKLYGNNFGNSNAMEEFTKHVQDHAQKICVDCEEQGCILATKLPPPITPSEAIARGLDDQVFVTYMLRCERKTRGSSSWIACMPGLVSETERGEMDY